MTQLWWKVKIGSILASPGPTPCQSPSSGRKMTLMDVIVVMVYIVQLIMMVTMMLMAGQVMLLSV